MFCIRGISFCWVCFSIDPRWGPSFYTGRFILHLGGIIGRSTWDNREISFFDFFKFRFWPDFRQTLIKIAGFEPWDPYKTLLLAWAIILDLVRPKLARFELKFDQHVVTCSLIIGGNYRLFSGVFPGYNKNKVEPDVIKTGCNKNRPVWGNPQTSPNPPTIQVILGGLSTQIHPSFGYPGGAFGPGDEIILKSWSASWGTRSAGRQIMNKWSKMVREYLSSLTDQIVCFPPALVFYRISFQLQPSRNRHARHIRCFRFV